MVTNDNLYDIYVEKVKQLAATIVVKSVDTALANNNYIKAFYGASSVDDEDPTTWKYYMNLAGQYHFTDTPMRIVSMDTLETIDFTVANLQIHRATARAYQYGTRQYQELLTQYPRQEALIRGILYPIDIATAVSAPDGKILGGYPAGLVEVNEYSLIQKLQKWIDDYRMRWYNRAYTVTDNLYLVSNLMMMYMYMVPAIMTFRLEACKTHEAHSFHVRQYLASHGFLDDFYDQLTTKQALSLYRNICYLERNPGQQQIFTWLTNKLLTERNLPLAEYTMRHDVSSMKGKPYSSADPTQVSMQEEQGTVYPQVFFKRKELNLGYSYDTLDRITVDQMLTKEQPTARDNAEFQADVAPKINEVMTNSLNKVLKTKALESAMVDYTDSTPYTMSDTLLNHWLWLSSKGLYTAVINVENPHTGERIALPAKEAFCFMWYAFCASIGFVLDAIPPIIATHVLRLPTPTEDDLLSVVDKTRIPRATATALLELVPDVQNLISTEAFYNKCRQIWFCTNQQTKIVGQEELHLDRGYVDNMFNRVYADVMVNVADEGEHYTQWFAQRNIDVSGWTKQDFGLVYVNILRAATGVDLTTTNSVVALQRAMVGMMQRLSSYSVQFMSYINSSTIVPLDWPMVRQGDWTSHLEGEMQIPNFAARLQNFTSRLLETLEFPVDSCSFDYHLHASIPDNGKIDLPSMIRNGGIQDTYYQRMSLRTQVTYTPECPPNDQNIIPVLGIDSYLQLSLQQRNAFKDVYGSCWVNAVTTPGLSDVITSRDLSGFQKF